MPSVFRISVDVNAFQWLIPADDRVWIDGKLDFDCQALGASWRPLEFYVHNPKRARGNFLNIGPGLFALDQTAREALLDLLEMCGELLPATIEGQDERVDILNVLECVNALDRKKSRIEPTGLVSKYVFHVDRLSESSIFKIPQSSRAEILTYTGIKNPVDEFRFRYAESGLTGLKFDLLWSDQ